MKLPSKVILVFLLGIAGCAHHRAPMTYRLVAGRILVPPGVANADVAQRTFRTNLASGAGKCSSAVGPVAVKTHGKHIQVTVTRELLAEQPIGWLNEWTTGLESQGCIAPGAGPKLAEQIAEAVPLDVDQAIHLLYSNQLDITPQMRMQVVSPILREGTANLLGYETAMYTVLTKAGGNRVSIVPLYADRHIGDATERRPEAATNYFRLAGEAAFYRVFYEAEQTEYAAIVVAASTRAELERRTKILETGAASCEKLKNELCVAVPKQVAINGLVPVTVNRIRLGWSGERRSEARFGWRESGR